MRCCIVGKSITKYLVGAITTISLSALQVRNQPSLPVSILLTNSQMTLPLQLALLSFFTSIFNISSAEKAKKSTSTFCQLVLSLTSYT